MLVWLSIFYVQNKSVSDYNFIIVIFTSPSPLNKFQLKSNRKTGILSLLDTAKTKKYNIRSPDNIFNLFYG